MSYFGDIENTSTRKYVYTATGSETSVTVADSGSTIAYRPGEVDVYKNGVKLISGSDYSAIGDGITDLTALSLNDVIEVIAYDYRKTGEGLVKLTDSNNWGATQNFPDGTEANPSISFTQDTDTGFYRKDDDTLGVSGSLYSIGDVSAASINNGQVGGFRNVIINGDFNIWQRGTSLSAGTGPRYLADRWFSFSTGSTIAPSRQEFVLGQTDVPNNPRYYHRCVVSSVTGAGNKAVLIQDIEGVHVLSGGSAVLSFWAKSSVVNNLTIELIQTFGTTSVHITPVKVSLSTSWQKFTIQIDIPSISGKTIDAADNKLRCLFWMDAGTDFNSRSDTLGHQSGTFDFADVQLEAGTRATPFERRPIAVEMPLCQRYYVSDLRTSVDFVASSTVGSSGFNFPVRMRAIPTITHTAIISQNISNTTVMDVSESGGNLQVISTSTTARTYRYTDIKADAEL